MMSRIQVSLGPEDYRRATSRAAELGISFAEYVRRLVRRDLGGEEPASDPSGLFDLGEAVDSDIARHKDDYVGAAVEGSR